MPAVCVVELLELVELLCCVWRDGEVRPCRLGHFAVFDLGQVEGFGPCLFFDGDVFPKPSFFVLAFDPVLCEASPCHDNVVRPVGMPENDRRPVCLCGAQCEPLPWPVGCAVKFHLFISFLSRCATIKAYYKIA